MNENLDNNFRKSTYKSVDKSSNATIEKGINISLEDNECITEEVDDEVSKNVQEAMTPLYPRCEKFIMLTFIIKLYGLKLSHGWSKKSFIELLQLLKEVCHLQVI